MTGTGFRAADAFVEITARLDSGQVLAAARQIADDVDRELTAGAQRAGDGMTDALTDAGDRAGNGLVSRVEGRMRDSRGRFQKAGTDLGDGVGKGAKDSADRSAFSVFRAFIGGAIKSGVSAGSGMAEALGQGFKGPAAPYLIAGLTAAVAVAAPFAGALLASGIAAGLGVGAIGAGVALAMRDPVIKAAASDTGSFIMETLESTVGPFKEELLGVFTTAKSSFASWQPLIASIMGKAATFLDPLMSGVSRLVGNLLPGIDRILSAARPTVVAIADGLSGIGKDLGGLFSSLSDNGAEMALAMTVAFALIRGVIQSVGVAINLLTEAFGFMVELAFRGMAMFGELGSKLQGMPGPIGAIGDKMVALSGAVAGGQAKWDSWRSAATGATGEAAAGTGKLDERTRILNGTMSTAISVAGGLSAAFKLLNGGALTAREAESAYEAAIDGVTASIKANGKTLDLHTEKGRNNDKALRGLIDSTDKKAQATYDETAATKGSEAAQAAATKVYQQGRTDLIKSAMAMGLSKSQAIALADKIMKIPKKWDTSADLKDKASAKAQAIRREIGKIHGKTVIIDVKMETHGSIQGEHIIGQGTQTKAAGGPIEGGSGIRDDVPVLAMGGEWMLRKGAVRALERRYGRGIMPALNNADRKPGGMPRLPDPIRAPHAVDPSVAAIGGAPRYDPNATAGNVTPAPRSMHFGAGAFTLDLSRIKGVADLIALLENLDTSARSYRAASPAGAW